MARYYDGQPEGIRALLGEAQRGEREYLKSRFDISQKTAAVLLAAGGVTTSESDFTLAMHGFSSGDSMPHSVHTLFAQYDLISDRFRNAERMPVAAVPDSHQLPNSQLLETIGMVAPSSSTWRMDESPLRYRVKGSPDNLRGSIELPVGQLHEWTEHMYRPEGAALTVSEEGTVFVAGVEPTASIDGSLPRPLERIISVVPHVHVGWKAILGSYQFDEKAHPVADKVFMDRIGVARAHFAQTHPLEFAAD